MAKYIDSIQIDRFRGISGVRLESLNHINILLGNNNSGKTSILECIFSLREPSSLWNYRSVFRTSLNSMHPLFEGMQYLFPVDSDDLEICYSFVNEKKETTKVTIQGELEKIQVQEREIHRINGLIPTGNLKDKKWDRLVEASCIHLKFYINDVLENEYDLYDFLRRAGNEKAKVKHYSTVLLRPMDHIFGEDNLSIVLENNEYNKKLVAVLKAYDRNIESIQSIQGATGSQYMIVSSSHQRAVPLSLYGDGMKKAVELVSAAVLAEHGILLIDEFETSIHTSAMEKTFRWILKMAKELDVQLFMTTHNKESLEKMLSMDEYTKDINVYTLTNDDGIAVREMSAEEAVHAIDNWGMDIRK